MYFTHQAGFHFSQKSDESWPFARLYVWKETGRVESAPTAAAETEARVEKTAVARIAVRIIVRLKTEKRRGFSRVVVG